jgi:hypothetical protein
MNIKFIGKYSREFHWKRWREMTFTMICWEITEITEVISYSAPAPQFTLLPLRSEVPLRSTGYEPGFALLKSHSRRQWQLIK